MNKTKTSLLLGIIATIGIATAAWPSMSSAAASWLGIVDGSVSVVEENPNLTKLQLTATDIVPMDTTALAGFAWFYDDGPNTVFAITTHEGVRDSTQNPDNWHAHNVVLGDAPATSDDDVDASLCIAKISDAPFAGVSIDEDSPEVLVNARTSELTGTVQELAAAFSIVVDEDCPITEPTEQLVPGGIPLGIIVEDGPKS